MTTIAVLAVQGAFIEHQQRLEALGCPVRQLRHATDMRHSFDGLVLPGGESTVQAKLLRDTGLFEPLRTLIQEGLPVLGTCAGLILLAQHLEGAGDTANLDSQLAAKRTAVDGFRTLPITVQRNAYGRQLGSFHAEGLWWEDNPRTAAKRATPVPLTFIRAPRIERVDLAVQTLVAYGGVPVAVRYQNQIGAAFHPELDADNRLYRLFLSLV
ncbi:MAG: pyridoxal 5'-phosphate synthase glutaminase subunit PdxT [Adlercreutzia sp.]|nr:pyridoxal 5'-phosphate synthase glutaminase subunit PdxT [Adlercreutzia sp.]